MSGKITRGVSALAIILICGTAYAEEPFPEWDINQIALAESSDMYREAITSLQDDASGQPIPDDMVAARARWHAESLEIVSEASNGSDVLFNRYVAWETKARNYIAAHWSEYSEYKQLSCIKETTKKNYVGLGLCVLGGVFGPLGDLPPASSAEPFFPAAAQDGPLSGDASAYCARTIQEMRSAGPIVGSVGLFQNCLKTIARLRK